MDTQPYDSGEAILQSHIGKEVWWEDPHSVKIVKAIVRDVRESNLILVSQTWENIPRDGVPVEECVGL